MLSKKVCRRCLNQKALIWNPTDEASWREGIIDCRSVFLSNSRREPWKVTLVDRLSEIRKPPPEWCLHRFEHAVAKGMSDAI